jgi:hypothetical protein
MNSARADHSVNEFGRSMPSVRTLHLCRPARRGPITSSGCKAAGTSLTVQWGAPAAGHRQANYLAMCIDFGGCDGNAFAFSLPRPFPYLETTTEWTLNSRVVASKIGWLSHRAGKVCLLD